MISSGNTDLVGKAVVYCLEFLLFPGVFMRDLTFFNDGNQKTLRNGLINFSKLRTIVLKVTSKIEFFWCPLKQFGLAKQHSVIIGSYILCSFVVSLYNPNFVDNIFEGRWPHVTPYCKAHLII